MYVLFYPDQPWGTTGKAAVVSRAYMRLHNPQSDENTIIRVIEGVTQPAGVEEKGRCFFSWELAGPDGANFEVFVEPEQWENRKAHGSWLRNSQDVVRLAYYKIREWIHDEGKPSDPLPAEQAAGVGVRATRGDAAGV